MPPRPQPASQPGLPGDPGGPWAGGSGRGQLAPGGPRVPGVRGAAPRAELHPRVRVVSAAHKATGAPAPGAPARSLQGAQQTAIPPHTHTPTQRRRGAAREEPGPRALSAIWAILPGVAIRFQGRHAYRRSVRPPPRRQAVVLRPISAEKTPPAPRSRPKYVRPGNLLERQLVCGRGRPNLPIPEPRALGVPERPPGLTRIGARGGHSPAPQVTVRPRDPISRPWATIQGPPIPHGRALRSGPWWEGARPTLSRGPPAPPH